MLDLIVAEQEKSLKGFVVAQAPFLGFVSMKNGPANDVSFVFPQGDRIDHLNRIADLGHCVRNSSQRGYAGSVVLGPYGEDSMAAALSGALCFMPCHWAAYAAAIAKFTPLAAYFAVEQQHSCCHPVEPSLSSQITSMGIDAVFYGTLAGLALGVGRRVLRKRKIDQLQGVLDEKTGDTEPNFSIVEAPEYSTLHDSAQRSGVVDLLKENRELTYRRPATSFVGKIISPVTSGLRKAGKALADHTYRENGRALRAAYADLAETSRKIVGESEEDKREVFALVARGYDRESASYASSLNPLGLAVKFGNFVKGFGQNHNWYRHHDS